MVRYVAGGNSSGGGAVSDASASSKGVIKLAGDLGGTAEAPTVPGLEDKASAEDLATASAADRSRANHTGSQSASTISDFTEAAQDAAAAALTAGTHSGITFAYDDAGNRISATVTGGGATDLTKIEALVFHDGTSGGGTRPTGYARVRYVGGTARPTNMAIGDIWEHDEVTVLASESWTGADGAPWPSQWTTAVANGGIVDINGNRGRLVTQPNAYQYGNKAYLDGMAASVDFDITVDMIAGTLDCYGYIMGRCTDSTATGHPTTGYYLLCNTGNSAFQIGKYVGGAQTDLSGQQWPGQDVWTAGAPRRIRFQGIGNVIRAKVWDPASTEPTAWLTSITDSTHAGVAGKVLLRLGNGGADATRTIYFDNLTVV